jgi:hypothetical protein
MKTNDTPQTRKPNVYRIALLVDALEVAQPIKDLVDWAESEPDIEICGLIVHPSPQSSVKGIYKFLHLAKAQGFYTALSRAAFAAMVKVEALFFLRSQFYRDRLASYSIGNRVPRHVITQPRISKSGFVYFFSDEDVEAVCGLDADLLIRCGNGILKGHILSAAKHGILSMHHGDNRVNRGGPAAFWEVFERHPYTGFIVQRLTAELDGGEVFFRGSITTNFLYLLNRITLYERSNVYLKKTIRDVLAGRVKAQEPLLYDNRLYKTPQLLDTLTYVIKTVGLLVFKLVRKNLGFRWNWGVGYTFGDWRNAVLWRSKTIPNPPGRFLADPFAFEHSGSHYVFVEDYSYADQRGAISAYKVSKDGAERLGVIVEEEFHLSFPFIFRYDGQIYMVPESSANRDIRLYRCAEFPIKWQLADILMNDLSAVDTIIFPKDDRWWMLTTINPTETGSNDAELHLYSSDSPIKGWGPHPANPVVMDASKGRNAGLLEEGTAIYRVAQRHGFLQYGKGSSIYRIDELSETHYSETKVQDIDHFFMQGIKGTHHIHHDNGLVVFDYVRNEIPSKNRLPRAT